MSENTIEFAKELTKIAIENGLIPKEINSSKMANSVINFYQTLVDNLEKQD